MKKEGGGQTIDRHRFDGAHAGSHFSLSPVHQFDPMHLVCMWLDLCLMCLCVYVEVYLYIYMDTTSG